MFPLLKCLRLFLTISTLSIFFKIFLVINMECIILLKRFLEGERFVLSNLKILVYHNRFYTRHYRYLL